MRFVLGVVLFAAVCSSALAGDGKGVYTIIGAGTASCGTWLQDHRAMNSNYYSKAAWVAGYITAANNYVATRSDIAHGIDANGLDAWIDNYCLANPLDSVGKASSALVAALLARPTVP